MHLVISVANFVGPDSTPWIGDGKRAQFKQLLSDVRADRDDWIVTIVGMIGIGKTALALGLMSQEIVTKTLDGPPPHVFAAILYSEPIARCRSLYWVVPELVQGSL